MFFSGASIPHKKPWRNHPLSFLPPSPPLEVGPPQIQLGDLGERSELSQRGLGRSPAEMEFGAFYSLKIWHLVAIMLIILLRMNYKVKRSKVDIYIPPLTWTWPAAVYNLKWRSDRQWHRWRSASSSSPLPERTDFGPCSLQPDRPIYAPVSRTLAFIRQCSPSTTHYF